MMVFRLTMLPASDGDCLLLSWGKDDSLHHMVVDGGRSGAYPALFAQLENIVQRGEKLDLYVLTHIDSDHISGALSYLRDSRRPIVPNCVWFNGYHQIKQDGLRSMKQADEYSQLLDQLRWPLNVQFESGVISIETAPDEINIAGLKIRIVSPTTDGLCALGDRWDKWRTPIHEQPQELQELRSGTREKPPIPDPLIVEEMIADGAIDTEVPNGSSIAFVAEWEGIRVLLAGDAHPDVLTNALAPFGAREDGRFRIDLMKASHHGSAKNTSRELIKALNCRRLAISTNGNIHGHPDPASIARFLHFGISGKKTIYFNYATPNTTPWGAQAPQEKYDYTAIFPNKNQDGTLEIDLLSSIETLENDVTRATHCRENTEI